MLFSRPWLPKLALFGLGLASAVYAQTLGTVTGEIKDASGAVPQAVLDGLLSLPKSWKLLIVNKAGVCHLTQKNDENFVVNIMPDSFVSAYLTVLHIVPEDFSWFKVWQNRYILLLQDNIDAESFRQLRVYLRWYKNAVNHHSKLSD